MKLSYSLLMLEIKRELNTKQEKSINPPLFQRGRSITLWTHSPTSETMMRTHES